jgi:hypothetical protein
MGFNSAFKGLIYGLYIFSNILIDNTLTLHMLVLTAFIMYFFVNNFPEGPKHVGASQNITVICGYMCIGLNTL